MPKLLTFDGPELDVVLARVRAEVGADATITSASKVRTGGVGGFFSKESFRVVVEAPDPAPKAAPVREVTPAPASLLELADLVDEAEADQPMAGAFVDPLDQPPMPVAPVVHTPVERPAPYVPSTEMPTFQEVMRNLLADVAPAPVPEPISSPPAAPVAPRRDQIERRVPRELLELGIPESMLPADVSPGTAVAALLRSLDLPAAPPLPGLAGAVTVVIGERRAAARLAADVAGELHLSKRDVWIAEPGPEGRPGRLVCAADAAAERRTWTGGPSVVALTAPPGARDLRWATSVLDALEPSAVWGVVGADRKTEDIAAWAEGLGGLDALALEHLDATVSPASVLQLGIPVARIEGQHATPALWAVVLAERLAA